MDAKITLSFDADIIERAKDFAEKNNMSLSRLTEFLFAKITKKQYASLEDLPLSDWITVVAEEQGEYIKLPPKNYADYFEAKAKRKR